MRDLVTKFSRGLVMTPTFDGLSQTQKHPVLLPLLTVSQRQALPG
jgi:hypothetical protein